MAKKLSKEQREKIRQDIKTCKMINFMSKIVAAQKIRLIGKLTKKLGSYSVNELVYLNSLLK